MDAHVGETIKRHRKRIPIKQEDMADKLELKRTTYASKEQSGTFTNEELFKIANILKVSVGELIEIPDLQEPAEFYGKRNKKVDPFNVIIHDLIMVKAMCRVMMRSLAESLAAQQGREVKEVFAAMEVAVKEETKVISNQF